MSQTCFSTTQDIPMCERKDVLDKLQEMVNDLEKTQKSIRQVPRVLIRSNFCECRKGNKEHSAAALQKERAQEKIPPQYFDYPQPAQLQGKPKLGPGGDGSASTCGDGVASADGCKAPVASNPLETAGGAECLQSDVKPKVTPSKSVREKERTCQKTPVVQQSAADNKTRLCNEDPLPEERKIDGPHPLIPVPQPHTYELRASKMIVGCDCLRRNGMQHDCQRTLCQGKRECLKFPAPVCQPSGLAPPIIIPSHIITADEPDCGPKRPKEKTKTQIEQRKILLNYARSQFQDKPPRPLNKLGSCKYHKKEQQVVNISEPVVARTLSSAAWTGTSLVNAGVALTLIMAVLASACLGLQYVYRYHKYQLAAHDDQDSFGGDSCGSVVVGRSRATSSTTLLSEVISLHRFRSQKHTRLNEEENELHEQLTKEKEEEEDDREEETVIEEGKGDKLKKEGKAEKETESLVQQTVEERPTTLEVPRTPQLPRRQLRLLKNRKFMSPVSPVAEEEDGTLPRVQKYRPSSCRPSASSSQSSTLTNGSSPPSILGATSKESKEKRNRERMLAGSEFSLTAPDLELDYYDYNVQNAEPGSYLSMDPAFCLWIPPFAPGIWNEEIELVETGDPYKSCESVCDKSSTLVRAVSNRALHMYATEDDSSMNLVEKVTESPVKVHQPYRLKEKETRVEKSPSDAGSEYYDLLENEGGIKYADEEDDGIKEDSPEKKIDLEDNKIKSTVIVEVHSKNVHYKKK